MVDNTELASASGGDTIATDDIGGVKFPRSKIIHGADGTNDGDVSTANPLPVELTDNNQTSAADLAAIKTAVEIIDNAISGSEMQVDIVSGNVTNAGTFAVQEDGAALTALQLIDDPVATDDTSTHATGTTKVMGVGAVATPTDGSIDANDIGMPAMSTDRRLHTDAQIVGQDANLTVDLGATDNAVLDAIAAAVEIMDDWDETNRAAVNLIASQVAITGGAGAVAANTPRVTLADDDPAVTALQIIDDWDETNRAAVNLIAGQVGIAGGTGVDGATVPRVSLATDVALPAGTNAIGRLAANSGVDIGDVDVLSIAAGSNLIGDVGIQGRTTGGLSTFYKNDLDETAVAVKASAGTLYAMHVINTTAAPLYLQLFDAAQGSVTVGTTTPKNQYVIPGNADSDGAGFTFAIPQGVAFATAITAACSTDSEGNSAPSANACHCNLFYK